MGVITLDCPHCLKENVAFQSVGQKKMTLEQKTDMVIEWLVFFSCGNCQQGVMAYVLQRTSERIGKPHDYQGGLEDTRAFTVQNCYPKKKTKDAPPHTPDNICHFYNQAVSLSKPGFWDAAALMGGKVLEVTFKTILPDFSGSLYKRINHLAEQNIITQSMKEWAHELRLIRNEAAHAEEKVNEEDVKALIGFIEVFLMYIFTLPGTLAARRGNSEDT